jgi:hypothetical protein
MKCPNCKKEEMHYEGMYTKQDWIKDNSILVPMAGSAACSIPLPSKEYTCSCGCLKFVRVKNSRSINEEIFEG